MTELFSLVRNFRLAIDKAIFSGEFKDDFIFYRFPYACCGDASELLAQFLLEHHIRTWYVCGTYYPTDGTEEENWENVQSHAWLTTANPLNNHNYIIIDITGDQFKNRQEYGYYSQSTYVGSMDKFHKMFEFDKYGIHPNNGLDALGDIARPRLIKLYRIIKDYL